jgi:hypothetical protein
MLSVHIEDEHATWIQMALGSTERFYPIVEPKHVIDRVIRTDDRIETTRNPKGRHILMVEGNVW